MTCPDCKGKGTIVLFTSSSECGACGGTGEDLQALHGMQPPSRQLERATGDALDALAAQAGVTRLTGQSDASLRMAAKAALSGKVGYLDPDTSTIRAAKHTGPVCIPIRTDGTKRPKWDPRTSAYVDPDAHPPDGPMCRSVLSTQDRKARQVGERTEALLQDMALCIPGLDTSPNSTTRIMVRAMARQLVELERGLEGLK